VCRALFGGDTAWADFSVTTTVLPPAATTKRHEPVLGHFMSTRKAPGCELIASIGHELQHVLEVLSDPGVRSSQDMYVFFDRKKPAGWRDAFETDEAEEVGDAREPGGV
jgi:hypothetical protein